MNIVKVQHACYIDGERRGGGEFLPPSDTFDAIAKRANERAMKIAGGLMDGSITATDNTVEITYTENDVTWKEVIYYHD